MISFFKKSLEENINSLREKVSFKRNLQLSIIQKSTDRDRFIKETTKSKAFFEKEGLLSMVKELDNKLEKSIRNHNESTIVDVAKIKKCDKEIISILKSNIELSPLLQYTDFIPEKRYINLLVTLTKAHKTGQISSPKLLSLKEYSPLIIKGNTVYVKDNRTHYADMILINDKNEILFTIRNKNDNFQPGKYCLPGGHVEKKEDPLFAAIRECKEETGIIVDKDIVMEAGEYSDDKVVICYYVAKFNGEPEVLEERELQQWEWVSIDDISTKPLIANLEENFEKVISIPKETLTVPAIASIMNYGDLPLFYKGMEVNLGIYNQEADSVEDETFEKGGKNAQIGEIRTWKGVKEQKTADGWVPVKESGDSGKNEKETKQKEYSPEELDKFSKQTSNEDLRTASEGANEQIRVAAKKELERRESEHKPEENNDNPLKGEVTTRETKEKSNSKNNISEKKYDDTTSITVGEDSGSRVRGLLSKDGKAFQIKSTFIKEDERGQGKAKQMYKDLLDHLEKKGVKTVLSDVQVEENAGKIYQSLEKEGYIVVKNANIKLEDDPTGKFWWDGGNGEESPFEIKLNNKEIEKSSILGEMGDQCIATIKEVLERGKLDKPTTGDVEKSLPVGTIREWSDGKYKKEGENKWTKISEETKEDGRGKEYNSPEYKFASKIKDLLEDRGIDKSFSFSHTDYGNSAYFTIHDDDFKQKLKIRISDHSVSNKDRIFNEQHESSKSDPTRIVDSIERAMYPDRYIETKVKDKYYSKYNNEWLGEADVDKESGTAWVKDVAREVGETQLGNMKNDPSIEILEEKYIRDSKRGKKLHDVTFKRKHLVGSEPVYKYERKSQEEIDKGVQQSTKYGR